MRLTDCKTEKLLPLFMRAQKDDLAIARELDPVIRAIGEAVATFSEWGYIDILPEEIIDALAWELDVDWYNPKADRTLEIKRELVKNADEVHRHLGTKAAVESVARDIFGEGHVEEWFEYGGRPGMFKLWTGVQLTEDNISRFMKTVSQVKNARSHLAEVTCRIIADLDGPDIDYEDIPGGYGDTEIYNDFRFETEIEESESITAALEVGAELRESESITANAEVYFSITESESINGKIVTQSDPVHYYNGTNLYDGSIRYNSISEEEDL